MSTLLQPPAVNLLCADGASARIALQGGHVLDWTPAGESHSRLYLSGCSRYAPCVAVRGGVPVIFPQFAGEGPLPRHGFARTQQWKVTASAPGHARLRLESSAATLAIWPHAFELELEVTVAGAELGLQLSATNTGPKALRFTAALHTYIEVSDISTVQLIGLQGLHYRDSAHGGAPGLERAPTLRIAGEVDRIYLDTPPELRLLDGARRLRIAQRGFADTVVWNPGPDKAAALNDLDQPQGYRRMLCVEAAVVGRPQELPPGARWTGVQRLVAEAG